MIQLSKDYVRSDKPDPLSWFEWLCMVVFALAVAGIVVVSIHLAEVLAR